MPINSQLEADDEDVVNTETVKYKLADGWAKIKMTDTFTYYRNNKSKLFSLTPVFDQATFAQFLKS